MPWELESSHRFHIEKDRPMNAARRFRLFCCFIFCLLSALLATPRAVLAQTQAAATTTTLSVSPSSPVTSGSLVTLTASVTNTGGAVLDGSVQFYDGTRLLGSTTLVSTGSAGFTPGTATFKTFALAVGSHSLTAKFLGTNTNTTSTSSAESLTISGRARTVSSLTSFANADGTYNLNATVTGAGSTTPTGTFEFDDTTTGSPLGTQGLTALTPGTPSIQTVQTGICPTAIAAGDLRNNGEDDLIIGTEDCSTQTIGSLEVLFGNGNGTFQAPTTVTIPTGFLPSSIAVADINGDGVPDLVVADDSSPRIATLLGNGDGTFQAPTTISLNADTRDVSTQVLVADFNHDGIPDILTAVNTPLAYYAPNTFFGQLCISSGAGDGTFDTECSVQGGNESYLTYAVGDFNGDGFPDEASQLTDWISNQPWVSKYLFGFEINDQRGFFSPDDINDTSTPAPTQISSPFTPAFAVGDVNHDGFDDAVEMVASYPSPEATILVRTGSSSGSLPLAGETQVPELLTPFALTNFNHDGNLDIVGLDPNGNFCVYTGNGDGSFNAIPNCTPAPGIENEMVVGDFRGFGSNDVAFISQSLGTPASGGIFLATSAVQSSTAAITEISATKGDIATASYSGDTSFAASISNAVTLGQQAPTALQITCQPLIGSAVFTFGENLTFTTTLQTTAGSQSNAPPTGTIQFYDGSTSLGNPVPISGNTATYSIDNLSVGTHVIRAVYSGDNGHAGSSSSDITIYVTRGVVNLTAQSSGTSSITIGTPITITGSLTASLSSPAPTGTVELIQSSNPGPSSNEIVLASSPISGNSPVSLTFPADTASQPFGIGTTYLFLNYSGNSTWEGINSSPIEITVQGVPRLTVSDNNVSSIASGTPLTLTGTITPENPTNSALDISGKLTVLDNGEAITYANIDSYSSTSYSLTINTATAPLNVGRNNLQLSYSGSTYWTTTTSSTLSLTVTPTPTLTLVSNAPNTGMVFAGSTVQLTANLGDLGNGPTPTGTIQFYDGSSAIGAPVTVASGQAAFIYTNFTAGAHSITAHYSGDSNYSSIVSSAIALQGISSITDTLSLQLSATGSVVSGGAFTATVLIQSPAVLNAPKLSGTLNLLEDGTVIATQPVTGSNTLQFDLNTLSKPLNSGTHTFTATYSGDSTYSSSTSAASSIQITGNAPGFTLTSSASGYSNVIQGSPVTFTATVSSSRSLGIPTGTVQFYVDGAAAGNPVTLQSGVATYTTSSLAPGQHTISAAYSGDTIYVATTTNSIVTVVTQGGDDVQLTQPTATTIAAEQPITLTGTLNVTSLGSAPTGTVSLLDNGNPISSTTLSGNAPFALSFQVNTTSQPLSAGVHSFTLQYAGSAVWVPATSAAQSITVQDFTLQAANTSLTVNAGSSTTTQLNVSDESGLNSTTSFSCSGLPDKSSCSFNPAQVSGSGSTTLTITTTATQTAELHWLSGGGVSLAVLLFFLPRRRRKLHRLLSLCLLLAITGLSSCGGSHMGSTSGGSGSGSGATGTPTGSYTVTVTTTTASSPAITHTADIKLTVQ